MDCKYINADTVLPYSSALVWYYDSSMYVVVEIIIAEFHLSTTLSILIIYCWIMAPIMVRWHLHTHAPKSKQSNTMIHNQ